MVRRMHEAYDCCKDKRVTVAHAISKNTIRILNIYCPRSCIGIALSITITFYYQGNVNIQHSSNNQLALARSCQKPSRLEKKVWIILPCP